MLHINSYIGYKCGRIKRKPLTGESMPQKLSIRNAAYIKLLKIQQEAFAGVSFVSTRGLCWCTDISQPFIAQTRVPDSSRPQGLGEWRRAGPWAR